MIDLANHCKLYRCDRGEIIWHSGENASFFGLVGTGFVKMVRSNSNGVDLTLEIMGPGQIFGLLGLIEGTGCPLTAYGLTDTTYLKISKAAFLDVYNQNIVLKDGIMRRTAVRFHQKLDFMAKLSSGRAEERIASVLLILADSYGKEDGDKVHIIVPLTRQALGEMAGTTTETTIRVLSKWTKSNLVQTDQHMITVVNREKLEEKLL